MNDYLNSDEGIQAETSLAQSATVISAEQWRKLFNRGDRETKEELRGDPEKEQEKQTSLSEKTKIMMKPKTAWQPRWRDKLIGWSESRWQRQHLTPSKRAKQEANHYYQGLYRTKGPNSQKLRQLIMRNGIPDWENQYGIGTAEYYDIHPEGILVGEAEFLLAKIEEELENNQHNEHKIENDRWLTTMEKAINQEEHQQNRQEQQWQEEGKRCWAIMLVLAARQREKQRRTNEKTTKDYPLDRLFQRVHADNLWFITVASYLAFPTTYLSITKQEVLKAARTFGINFPTTIQTIVDIMQPTGEQTTNKQLSRETPPGIIKREPHEI